MMQTQGKPMQLKIEVKQGYGNAAVFSGPTCDLKNADATRTNAERIAGGILFDTAVEYLRPYRKRISIGTDVNAKVERFGVALVLADSGSNYARIGAQAELYLGDVLKFGTDGLAQAQERAKAIHDATLARLAAAFAVAGLTLMSESEESETDA